MLQSNNQIVSTRSGQDKFTFEFSPGKTLCLTTLWIHSRSEIWECFYVRQNRDIKYSVTKLLNYLTNNDEARDCFDFIN